MSWLGYLLISLPFILIFCVGVLLIGFWQTVATFILCVIVCAICGAGVYLIENG